MKNIVFVLLFFMLPNIVFSQTKADYERVMGKFQNFYNDNKGDSISNMFDDQPTMFNKELIASLFKQNGKMTSYKYMAIEPGDNVVLFKSTFNKSFDGKSVHAVGMTIGKNQKIGTFRFFTSSPFIDSVLKKN